MFLGLVVWHGKEFGVFLGIQGFGSVWAPLLRTCSRDRGLRIEEGFTWGFDLRLHRVKF